MSTLMQTDSPTRSMAGRELPVLIRCAAHVAPVRGTGLPVTGWNATARFGIDRISGLTPNSGFTPNYGVTLGIHSSRRPLS